MTTPIRDLPAVGDHWREIHDLVAGRAPAVFLDFDGTLSPIVDDPAAAALPERTRAAIERLRDGAWVAIMSGRDAEDVRSRVRVEGIVYAGSHGFDVIWPDGRREVRGEEYRDSLERAEAALREQLEAVPGAELEPKRFAIAIHYRRVGDDRVSEVDDAVGRVAARFDDLRRTGGKKVHELRPDLDWDKGRALAWLLDELAFDRPGVVPLYLGDDLTDEDAFAVLEERGSGIGLVVRGEDDERPTLARYAMADVTEAGELLERIAELREEHGS